MKIINLLFCLLLISIIIVTAETLTNKQKELLSTIQIMFNEENYNETIDLIDTKLKEDEELASGLLYLFLGNSNRLLNRNQKAIDAYLKGITIAPESYELLNNLASVCYTEEDFKNSAKYFLMLLNLKTELLPNRNFLLYAGLSYYNLKDYFPAIKLFEKGVLYYPDDSEFRILSIKSLIELQNYDEAERMIKNYVDIKPLRKELYKLLGNLYINKGLYNEAIIVFEMLKPFDTSIINTLAEIYLMQEMYDEAIDLYEQIISNDTDTETIITLAKIYFNNDKLNKALSTLNKINIIYSDELVLLKSRILFNLNNFDETIEILKNHLHKTETSNMEIYYLLGFSYFNISDYENAIKYLNISKYSDRFKENSILLIKKITELNK